MDTLASPDETPVESFFGRAIVQARIPRQGDGYCPSIFELN